MYAASFKVCIFGDAGVGKSALTHRFITNRFIQDTRLTLGVDIVAKDLTIENLRIKLQIWDFGGEERFRVFLPIYARGSSGGIFMYDITRKNSLGDANEWLYIFKSKLSEEEKQKIPVLMVGGKKDINEKKSVSLDDAMNIANRYNLYNVIECSAKTGENVEEIFKSITFEMLKISNYI
jgi:small GTP-binding protein